MAGATGKVGRVLCEAVEAAPDLDLAARVAPSLDGAGPGDFGLLAHALASGPLDVVVDFTRPDVVVAHASLCVETGVPLVLGTTGLTDEERGDLHGEALERGVPVFVAPNFAIGAVLMMRFAAEASRHMQAAEIIEYHHPAKLDAPSGTAKRTAELMAGEVPIHAVRLPGLVADQDVVLGDVAQTLTIRHVTTDRTSFMPGVLLAVRRVGGLQNSPTVGLERLLDG